MTSRDKLKTTLSIWVFITMGCTYTAHNSSLEYLGIMFSGIIFIATLVSIIWRTTLFIQDVMLKKQLYSSGKIFDFTLHHERRKALNTAQQDFKVARRLLEVAEMNYDRGGC